MRTDDSLLVSAPEAARRLSISVRHLWKLARDGVIPCVRMGKCVRFSIEELRAWIAQQSAKES